jgi:molybdopterin molybdotransferase
MQALITVDEAESRIASVLASQPIIACPIEKAAGRILRAPILADRDLPPFDRVMMDGIAIRYADLALRHFKLVGRQHAGEPAQTLPGESGVAIEIATGAVRPKGADCIVPREWYSENEDGTLSVRSDYLPPEWQFVHRRGSDARRQDVLVRKGRRLGPAEIGVAASCGLEFVEVSQNFRIAIVSTGSELVSIGEEPLPHQIRMSNAAAIEAALSLRHHPSQTLWHIPDDLTVTELNLRTLLDTHEVLIVTGGISMGRADRVPEVLDALGAECHFHGVAQRPGKPMGFWTVGRTLIFTLPGNPVSALVGLHRYVLPALDRASELTPSGVPRRALTETLNFTYNLTWFLPVRIQVDAAAKPVPVHNSGDYSALAESDGFLELAAAAQTFRAGEAFPFFPWAGSLCV